MQIYWSASTEQSGGGLRGDAGGHGHFAHSLSLTSPDFARAHSRGCVPEGLAFSESHHSTLQATNMTSTPTPAVNPSTSVIAIEATPEGPAARAGRKSWRELVVQGSIWTVGGEVAGQGIRLASNLILTRLLAPDIFGLLALVLVFNQLLETFSDVGIRASVIQNKRGDDPRFLNTAWSVQVIRGLILWVGSCGIALALWGMRSQGWLGAESVYADPTISILLPLVGLNSIANGFASTKLLTLNRHLEMNRLIAFETFIQVVHVAAMIVWAIISPTYWALIGGGFIAVSLRSALSHVIFDGQSNRFAWDRDAAREMYQFGRWILISTIWGFFGSKGSRLIIAVFMTSTQLGVFVIGAYFSKFISSIVDKISKKVLFSAFARSVDDPEKWFISRLRKVRLWTTTGIVGAAGVLFIVAQPLIDLLYDARYSEAGWMMQVLLAGRLLRPIDMTDTVVLARGDSFSAMLLRFCRFLAMMIALVVGGLVAGLTGVVVGVAVANVLDYPAAVWIARKHRVWLPMIDAYHIIAGAAMIGLGLWLT